MKRICSICANDDGLRTLLPCAKNHSSREDVYQDPDQDTFLYDEELTVHNIRLIQIENGSGDDEIQIHLNLASTEAHSDQPRYQALSYVWGTSPAIKTIACNDVPLHVGQNLYHALWRIREDGDTDLPWWVDAVCINQKNISEKNTQVRKMKEIYENAYLVLAWIGQEKEGDAAGFELFRTIYGQLADHADELPSGGLTRRYDSLRQLGLPPMQDPQWKAMVEILYRDYFYRIWIIQEILVAQQCVFKSGNQTIGRREIFAIGVLCEIFQSIKDAIQAQIPAIVSPEEEESDSDLYSTEKFREAMEDDSILLEDLRYKVFSVRDLWLFSVKEFPDGESSDAGFPIVRLLSRTAGFNATNELDKIFALVGLSSDVNPLIIDYRKSITQVQLEIAKICLEQNECWGPLLFSYINSAGHSSDLPSWVPDWVGAPNRYASLAGYNCYRPYYAGTVWWSINLKNEMFLPAHIFDAVETIVHHQPYNVARPKLLKPAIAYRFAVEMNNWIRNCLDLVPQSQKYITGESAYDAFWRTLVCNREEKGIAAPDDLATCYVSFVNMYIMSTTLYGAGFAAANRLRQNYKPSPQTPWATAWRYLYTRIGLIYDYSWIFMYSISMLLADKNCQRFAAAFAQYALGRKFFRSEKGFIGWVPEATREGDLLCLFQRCYLPFVVRRDRDGYRIVGEAYVHGNMDIRYDELQELPFDTLKLV